MSGVARPALLPLGCERCGIEIKREYGRKHCLTCRVAYDNEKEAQRKRDRSANSPPKPRKSRAKSADVDMIDQTPAPTGLVGFACCNGWTRHASICPATWEMQA